MSAQLAGSIVDAAGVTIDIDDADLVSDVLVVAKVHGPDGTVAVLIGASESQDWITQRGLMAAAADAIIGTMGEGA